MTGTADKFNAEFAPVGFGQLIARRWGHMYTDAKRLLMNLLGGQRSGGRPRRAGCAVRYCAGL